jgi:hypothetical protein
VRWCVYTPAPLDPLQVATGQTLTKTLSELVQWRARSVAYERRIADLEKQLGEAKKAAAPSTPGRNGAISGTAAPRDRRCREKFRGDHKDGRRLTDASIRVTPACARVTARRLYRGCERFSLRTSRAINAPPPSAAKAGIPAASSGAGAAWGAPHPTIAGQGVATASATASWIPSSKAANATLATTKLLLIATPPASTVGLQVLSYSWLHN